MVLQAMKCFFVQELQCDTQQATRPKDFETIGNHGFPGNIVLHSTLHALHSTLHTSHCTVYTPHCPLCPLCPLYTSHFALHTLHFTLHSTLYTLHSHLTIHTPQSTLHTLHSTLYTRHSTLHTLHSHFTLHTPHYSLHFTLALYTSYATPYTLHFTVHIDIWFWFAFIAFHVICIRVRWFLLFWSSSVFPLEPSGSCDGVVPHLFSHDITFHDRAGTCVKTADQAVFVFGNFLLKPLHFCTCTLCKTSACPQNGQKSVQKSADLRKNQFTQFRSCQSCRICQLESIEASSSIRKVLIGGPLILSCYGVLRSCFCQKRL